MNIIKSEQDFLSFIRDQAMPNGNLSIRGVARCCSVHHNSIIDGGDFKSVKLAQTYTEHGLECGDLVENGFNPQAVWLAIEYFAYESKAAAPMAKQLARTFGAIGVKHVISQLTAPAPAPEQSRQLPTSFEVLVDATKLLPSITNPIIKAAFEQRLAEELGANSALPGSAANPVLAAVLARDLGYSLKPGEDAKLGKWVRRYHEPLGQAQHGRYQVNVYDRTPELQATVKAFFD
jgi:hypothetical protein